MNLILAQGAEHTKPENMAKILKIIENEIMELDEKKIPTIFKAFCDENRVKILKLLLT